MTEALLKSQLYLKKKHVDHSDFLFIILKTH